MKKYLIGLVLLSVLVAVPASAATLTATQISAIIGLLQAFGADQSVINNVRNALSGTTSVSASVSSNTGTSQGLSSDAQPAITVTSPNGGEGWNRGEVQSISWKTNLTDPTVDLSLVPYYQPCVAVLTNPCPSYPYRPPYIIRNGTVNNGLYKWPVGAIINSDGTAGSAPAGMYIIQVCKSSDIGHAICDRSDSYFKIYDSTTTNKPPVITGLTAPTNLKLGEMGTWVVKAYDPEGGPLSYTVDWGEPQFLVAKSSSVGQEASFTHVYNSIGTYKVSITAVDNLGQAAVTSAAVNVGSYSQVNKPPVITSVSGPTTLNVNEIGRWVVNAYDPEGGALTYKAYWGDSDTSPVVREPYFSHSFTTVGTYRLSFEVFDDKNQGVGMGASVQILGITTGSSTPAATITVTSPQPNEIWRWGNIKNITWTTTNLGADALINIRAIDTKGAVIDLIRRTYNTGKAAWSVGQTADYGQLPAGFYRIRACIAGPTGDCDKSSEQMLEIKEPSTGTSAGTTGAAGGTVAPSFWNWLGQVIMGQ